MEVPEGTTILRAAEMHGIAIPKLCDFEGLSPYGGCRLCVVEVEGLPALQTSCTLPVSEDMRVHTDTPRVKQARQFVLGMLFGERNHFCMYCQASGGDCDLQNAALNAGMDHWPAQPAWNDWPVDASHPYFILDHNRCILCRRCVRACAELVGNHTLGTRERGARTQITADDGLPWGESSCIRCGTCVQVCPTGALIERHSAYLGLGAETRRVRSICTGCSVGCGLYLRARGNRIVRIESHWKSPANRGVLCEQGRIQPFYDQRQRVETPLIRREGALKPASWQEALQVTADGLRSTPNLGALISTRLPAESLAAFTRLFRDALHTPQAACLEEGYPIQPDLERALPEERRATLDDLRQADAILVIGARLDTHHPVAGFAIQRSLPDAARLLVCGLPEDDPLYRRAHTRLHAENGYAALFAALADEDSPDAALCAARRPVFVLGRGFTACAAPQDVHALLDLAQRLDARLLVLYGKANSRAALAYGLQQPVNLEQARAVYLALGDDEGGQSLLPRLERTAFVAVQAAYHSPLTARADVVLPVTTWAEEGGHYLNLEGRLQKSEAAVQPPEGVHTNLECLQRLAFALHTPLSLEWQTALMVNR
ncbi:MAG: 2Fe-2S iron-sulfur cluster-binding protein [Anaerolineales bacterium]